MDLQEVGTEGHFKGCICFTLKLQPRLERDGDEGQNELALGLSRVDAMVPMEWGTLALRWGLVGIGEVEGRCSRAAAW